MWSHPLPDRPIPVSNAISGMPGWHPIPSRHALYVSLTNIWGLQLMQHWWFGLWSVWWLQRRKALHLCTRGEIYASFHGQLHMLKIYFDTYFNSYGVEVNCGQNTKKCIMWTLVGMIYALVQDQCKSRSTPKIQHSFLWLRRLDVCMIVPWLRQLGQNLWRWKIEHQLIINDVRYVLVQVTLTNCSHFVRVSVVKCKYLYYNVLSNKGNIY